MGERSSGRPPARDFVWQGDLLATYGDISDAMSRIHALADIEERQRTAEAFMAAYREASPHADANVGYLCGYYGHDTMVEMLRLFRTAHPIFGGPALADKVTGEGAIDAGKALGERMSGEASN